MTKSTKRKKERSADFTKKRLKLGKGKQAASNVVDTSFKARSIALPQQTIAATRDTEQPTTKRKLTLDDLIAHMKHYSPGMRKDALQGLQELLDEHGFLVQPNLAKLINACARLMSDEDASVRKALHSFLAWLLPRVPTERLKPYSSTLLLFTTSALSHIFAEIRIDAVRLLDLFLEYIPQQVVDGLAEARSARGGAPHGKKILDGYLGLLNIGIKFSENGDNTVASSSSSQTLSLMTLSPASKALVLTSFSNFVGHAIATLERKDDDENRNSMPTWFMASSFSSKEANDDFRALLRTSRFDSSTTLLLGLSETHGYYHGAYPFHDISNEQKLGDLDMSDIHSDISALMQKQSSEGSLDSAALHLILSLTTTVHPVLVSTFLDCAPSVFSPTQTNPESETQTVQALMRIAQYLYGHLLRTAKGSVQAQKPRADLRALISHISIYFPFGENRVATQDLKTIVMHQELNVIYCELFALQAFEGAHNPLDEIKGENRGKLSSASKSRSQTITMDKQREAVEEFVIQYLRGSATDKTVPVQSPSSQSYISLLPTLWWLLGQENCQKRDGPEEILQSVLTHATKASPTSNVKQIATEFIARLLLVQSETGYLGHVRVDSRSSDAIQSAFRSWMMHLPKVLWSIGDKDLRSTEMLLYILLRLSQRRCWLLDSETLSGVCSRFAPYFTMQHAARGEMRGPFANLDKISSRADIVLLEKKNAGYDFTFVRRLALDTAATLLSTAKLEAQRQSSGKATPARKALASVSKIMLNPGAAERNSAFELLAVAVAKAVAGTKDEIYWRGISGT